MRKPFMAGNWKMNGTKATAREFIDNFSVPEEIAQKRQIVICMPFTLLSFWSEYGSEKNPAIEIGAENVYPEPKGAYTGEISVEMLKDAGAAYCIVGHSERRDYFDESDRFVNMKMNALLDGGVTPIVCVGESLDEREKGITEEVVGKQLAGSIIASGGDRDLSGIVVAYEPIWAIGTGKTATSDQAEEVCAFIRSELSTALSPAAAGSIRILYGGSMKPSNVDELMSKPNIDGGLVGGASLKADDFSRIAAFEE